MWNKHKLTIDHMECLPPTIYKSTVAVE